MNKIIEIGKTVYIGTDSQVPFEIVGIKQPYLVRIKEKGTNYQPSWIDVSLTRLKK